ncbi:MAG: IPT/TIG domain-containing protein [Gemmatimonadota bacterium]|nr:IPT/TIG domain-containing protein [Gemmatimonadota bacterium]MDH5760388.1 IPT/TIG domain-containing protein [Gemmatimonadota bacterium]
MQITLQNLTGRAATRLFTALSASVVFAACGDSLDGPAPIISNVEPATGTVGTEVHITGSDFRVGASVSIGSFAATGVDVGTSGTEIFASVPAGVTAGTSYDVTVENTDGSSDVFAAAFTAIAPVLQFVNGATKPSGNSGSTVILEGDAFGDVQGAGQVLFSNGTGGTVAATIAGVDDWTNTFILTTVPAGAVSGPVLVETGTGQSGSLPFTVTQNATFSPSTISWTETQGMSAAISGHSATYVPIDDAGGNTVERVYVFGGAGNNLTPRVDVEYSEIQADGSLGSFTAGTALTTGVAYHSTVAATPFNSKVRGSGYLYVMGGINADGGQPVSAITRVPLNQDGSTGTATSAGSLPAPLHSFGAAIFRSTIYVAGGATTDNAAVATVYRAAIDTLGNIGAWEELDAMPQARSYVPLVIFGGTLYVAGGETAAIAVDDATFNSNATKLSSVVHARLNLRNGLIAAGWTTSGSSLQKARSKHMVLAAGGSLFISSGLYAAAGTGSSENVYGQINADGTLASFNGATGSNTLLSVGGTNLFNGRAVSYIDASGVAHVMVLGGADVTNATNKSSKVIFY